MKGGKQYHKGKPVNWGEDECVDDVRYAGKGRDLRDHITNMGLASGVVLKLAQSIYGRGHMIYTDQFYISLHLLTMLRQMNLSGCGTVITNQKYYSKSITKPKNSVESMAPRCGVNAERLALSLQDGHSWVVLI